MIDNGMKKLLAELEDMQPEGLRLLEQMVSLDSPSFDKSLVDELGRVTAAAFEKLGGAVSRTPEEDRGDHLTIRFPGGSGRPIMLLGHLDTVWPAGEGARRPFQIRNGIATGPGVFDMKAGIVMMWMALAALHRVRGKLPTPIWVLLVSNEEVGSPGSRALVTKTAEDVSAVLVMEPSLPGGALKTRRNGLGRFQIKAIGRTSHTGINPSEGINSIEEIAHQTLKLQALADPAKHTFVTVAMIRGGTRPNMVPAECSIQVDVRTQTQAESERVTALIESLEPVLNGSRIEIQGGFSRPPLERTPQNRKLFEIAHSIARELGHILEEGATGGTSDGNLTSGMGIPTLDGLGPVGLGAHQTDEQIDVSSLPWRTALVAGLIERIAASPDTP